MFNVQFRPALPVSLPHCFRLRLPPALTSRLILVFSCVYSIRYYRSYLGQLAAVASIAASVRAGAPDCPLGGNTYTATHLEAENLIEISKISDGNWHCAALLDWKGPTVCTDSSVQHYGWAQNCPINCAKANGAKLIGAFEWQCNCQCTHGLGCGSEIGTCLFPDDAALLKPTTDANGFLILDL